MSSSRAKVYLAVIIALLFGLSCVYFNTMFMAEKKFKQAEKNQYGEKTQNQNIQGQPQGLPRPQQGNNQSRLEEGVTKATAQDRALYDDVIKKAGTVLKYHPNSKWVDEALWLIGKSYFNTGEYTLADRKFKELVTNHPESKYADDSYYFMGLCEIFLGHSESALTAFSEIEHSKKKSPYMDDVYFTGGVMAINSENYSEAIDLFKKYLAEYPKEDSSAQATFLIGKCRENLGDYMEAYRAYKDVEKYKPSKQLYFDATIAAASAILRTDSIAVGMAVLLDLADNQKYFSRSGEIRMKIAEGYYLEKQFDKAIEIYKTVTEKYPRTNEAAEAYYRLGIIYQNDLFDVKSAKESFTKAQSEFPQSEYRNLAAASLAQIGKLESYQKQIQRADSLEKAIAFDADSSNSSDTVKSASDSLYSQTSNFEPHNMPDTLNAIQQIDSTHSPDSLNVMVDSTASPNLNLKSDSLAINNPSLGPYLQNMIKSLNAPAIAPEDSSLKVAIPDSAQTPIYGPIPERASKAQIINLVDSAGFAELKARQDSIRQDILTTGVEARYQLAELYAYELNRPDSALNEFKILIARYPNSQYATKSLLASSYIEFNRGDSISANTCLRDLVDKYPRSVQAAEAADLLDFKINLSDNAIGLYAVAESLVFQGNNPDSALALYKYIASEFPDLAPQASFAVAWILDQVEGTTDSSAYYAYSLVNEKYPQTAYADAAKLRIGIIKKEEPQKTPRRELPKQNEEISPDSSNRISGGFPAAPPVKITGDFTYPLALYDRDIKGNVIFKIKMDMSGKVQEHEIIGPSGEPAIDSAATTALLRTVFDTSKLDLIQLDSYFQYSFHFKRPVVNMYNNPYDSLNRGR